jgi:uncharacterized protein (TIGR02145 family)
LLILIDIYKLQNMNGHEINNNQSSGFFVDGRDGHVYKTIIIGNQLWMAENLDFNCGEGCFNYFRGWTNNGDEIRITEYGQLYSREAAMKSCPSGWRIPCKKDFEILLANYKDELEAYNALIINGSSGFDAHLAGWKCEHFSSDFGYGEINLTTKFWSTEKQTRQYREDLYEYLYVQGKNSKGIIHVDIYNTEYISIKKLAMSARCIKE